MENKIITGHGRHDVTRGNPNDCTPPKKVELVNKFSKVAGYKINTQKSGLIVHTNNKKSTKRIKK